MAAEPIADYIVTEHAATEIERRGLSLAVIDGILQGPEQRLEVRPGRVVLQSRVQEFGTEYLIRVFVDIDRQPAEVVTAYRTNKLLKYWRAEV